MSVRKSLAMLLGATFVLLYASSAFATQDVSLGTLAPKRSPWGKVFTVWAKALKKKTNGEVGIRWYFNGQQGD